MLYRVADKVDSEVDALKLRAIQAAHHLLADSSDAPVSKNSQAENAGFVGYMQQFVFNGNAFFEMARTGKISNIETTAKFRKRDTQASNPITFTSPEAFLTTHLKLYATFTIGFLLRTTQPNGIIMYSGGGKGKDFMALELVNGHVSYVFNVGSGPRVVRVHHRPINDNKWHDISIVRPTLNEHVLRVDDATEMDKLPDMRSVHFDTSDVFYIGGIKKHLFHSLPRQVKSREGFQGCLASLDLAGETGNLLTHHRSEVPDHYTDDVIQGCAGRWTMPGDCENMSF